LFAIAALFVPVTFIALLMRDLMAQGYLSPGEQVLFGVVVFLLLLKSLFVIYILYRRKPAETDPVPRDPAELTISGRELFFDLIIVVCVLTMLFAYKDGLIHVPTRWLATDNELVRNVLLAVMSSLAKVETEKISDRVKAGLQRAVAKGKRLGRPRIDAATEQKARKMLAKGVGMLKVASALGVGSGTVQRIAHEMRE